MQIRKTHMHSQFLVVGCWENVTGPCCLQLFFFFIFFFFQKQQHFTEQVNASISPDAFSLNVCTFNHPLLLHVCADKRAASGQKILDRVKFLQQHKKFLANSATRDRAFGSHLLIKEFGCLLMLFTGKIT